MTGMIEAFTVALPQLHERVITTEEHSLLTNGLASYRLKSYTRLNVHCNQNICTKTAKPIQEGPRTLHLKTGVLMNLLTSPLLVALRRNNTWGLGAGDVTLTCKVSHYFKISGYHIYSTLPCTRWEILRQRDHSRLNTYNTIVRGSVNVHTRSYGLQY
jgi:hypothetical protein